MGRELKRVPLDFEWPINTIWYGYMSSMCHYDKHHESEQEFACDECRRFAQLKNISILQCNCPDFDAFLGPPAGDGYQLWCTTCEGKPLSPVFSSLDELCAWCEVNATVFAHNKATKGEWKAMFEDGLVCHKEGNIIFM